MRVSKHWVPKARLVDDFMLEVHIEARVRAINTKRGEMSVPGA